MSGLKALSQTKFYIELKTREGITQTKSKHGVEWKGIDLKTEWVTGSSNPSPTTVDAKGDGFEKNAQPTSDSPTRGNFAHFAVNPSPDSGCNPSPITVEGKNAQNDPSPKVDLSHEEFLKNVQSRRRNTCRLCGQFFQVPLTIGYQGGYICEPCRRDGAPTEPAKPDSQMKLKQAGTA
jgi:hypothetical protein